MSVSQKGIDFIRSHEGLELEAYPDPATGGVPWTIGYGHTKGVKKGQKIDKATAERFLAEDIRDAELGVTRNVNVPLTQDQFDALTSFVFNLGEGAFQGSTLLRKLNQRDYDGAAAEFNKWVMGGPKGKKRKIPGLVTRRAAERKLFEGKA